MKIWVDPPTGWRYGFPKVFDTKDGDMRVWLVEQGYPQAEIEDLGEHFYVRQWAADEKDVST